MKTQYKKKGCHQMIITLLLVALTLAPLSASTVHAAAFKKPEQVRSVKISVTSASSVKLSWGRVKAAKGYQIYMASPKHNKYQLVKTIPTNATVRYTKTGLAAEKRYRFKIRAYANVGRITVYGQFSAVKIATI